MKQKADEILVWMTIWLRGGLMSLALLLSLALTASRAQATACFWTGDGGDNKFSTAANWHDGVLPSTDPASPNSLVFNGVSGVLTNDLENVAASSIQFSGCGAITLAGNAIAIVADGSIISQDNASNPVLDLPVDFRSSTGGAGSGDLAIYSGNVRFAGGVTANKFHESALEQIGKTIDGHIVLTSATDETSANFTVLGDSSITVNKLVLPSDKLVIEEGGAVTATTARMPGSGGSSFLVKKNNGLFVVTDTLTIGDLDHGTTYFMSSEKDLAGVFAFNKLEVLAQAGGPNLLYFQRPMQFVVGSGGINTANCAIQIASSEYLRSSDDYAIARDGNNPVIKASGDLYLDTSDWNDPTVPHTITIEGLVNSTDTTMSSGGVTWTNKLGKLKVVGNGTVRFVNLDGDVKSDVALEMNAGTTLAVPEEGYDHGGAFTVKDASAENPILVKIGDGEILNGSYKVISAASIPDGDPNGYLKFADEMSGKATFRKDGNAIYCDVCSYIWDAGTAPTAWNTENIWRTNEVATSWVDDNCAVFSTKGAQANLTEGVAAEKVVFLDDAVVSGLATLAVPEVAVAADVSATISAPTAGTLEKTGKGTLTLGESRTEQTTVSEGTLAMANGATVDPSKLTLGTDAAKPVTFDYGAQTLSGDLTPALGGYDVSLTNGNFTSTAKLVVADGTLRIKKGASVSTTSAHVVVGGTTDTDSSTSINAYLEIDGGAVTNSTAKKHLYIGDYGAEGSVSRVTVKNGGSYYSRQDIIVAHRSTGYLTVDNSTVEAYGYLYFCNDAGCQAGENGYVSLTNNGVLSVQRVQYGKGTGNGYFNFDGGTLKAAAGASELLVRNDRLFVTVNAAGGTIDNNGRSFTINADLLGEGDMTLIGSGTITIGGSQTGTGALNVNAGTVVVDGDVSVARPVTVKDGAKFTVKGTATKSVGSITLEAGSTLDLNDYAANVAAIAVTNFAAPTTGTAALKRNGGAFTNGTYAVLTKTGVTAADAANLVPAVADGSAYAYTVDGDTLKLTVFTYDFPAEWHGGKPVTSEIALKFHEWKDKYTVTAFPLASEPAFLLGVNPADGAAAITITAISNDEVETDKIVTIQTANDFTLVNGRLVVRSFATLDPATKVAVDSEVTPAGTVRVGDDKTSVTGLDGSAPAQFYQLVVDYGDDAANARMKPYIREGWAF